MTRTNDRSDVIYDDSIPDHEIITIHGDVLIERMEELGLSTDYEDDWSDLLVRMYRVRRSRARFRRTRSRARWRKP